MKILQHKLSIRRFQIDDRYLGRTITEVRPCLDTTYCESTYLNYEVCGGFKIVDMLTGPRCPFFCTDDYKNLTDVQGGEPL